MPSSFFFRACQAKLATWDQSEHPQSTALADAAVQAKTTPAVQAAAAEPPVETLPEVCNLAFLLLCDEPTGVRSIDYLKRVPPGLQATVQAAMKSFEESYNAGDFASCGGCYTEPCHVTV